MGGKKVFFRCLFLLPVICHCLLLKKGEEVQEHFSDAWQDWQHNMTPKGHWVARQGGQ